MKVLHVIPSVSPLRGGPSKAVLEMVAALNHVGVAAEIATTNDNGPNELNVELQKLVDFNGIPVRFFKRFSPSITPVKEFAFSSQYRKWLINNIDNYDIIHVHAIFSFMSSYTMWLARKRNVKYIVRPIGQLETWSLQQSRFRKMAFLTLFEKANLARASAIHFTASSELNQATSALPHLANSATSKLLVIPLGIHIPKAISDARLTLQKRYRLASDKPILLYLSRIHPKKGLELLFNALSKLEQSSFQLLIAGNGDPGYLEELKLLCKTQNIDQQCHFIGFKSGQSKQELLQGADLYVLTSHSENFGIAVLESLAAGTPALVSHEVALSKLISDQKLGYTCDLNASAIQAKLEHCLNDPTKSEMTALGAKSAAYVKAHYRWSTIALQLQSVYEEIFASAEIE